MKGAVEAEGGKEERERGEEGGEEQNGCENGS